MKIENAEQFDRVFPAIANELTYANVYYNLYRDLNSSFAEYVKEVNNSVAFWGIARDSIRDVSFLSLCRVYDPESNANSLPNLFKCVRDTPNFLDLIRVEMDSAKGEEKRVRPKSDTKIDSTQLEDDISFVSPKTNPLVKRLISWRGNIFVHINSRTLALGNKLSAELMPKYEDFEVLLVDGMKVINRYADLFRSTEYSTHFGQKDDFRIVLESVRENLKLHEARLDAEFAKYGIDRETFTKTP
jgi:hypothetical protein